MGYNPISDVGISQIMDGLQVNTSLTKLDVTTCGLLAEGRMFIYMVDCFEDVNFRVRNKNCSVVLLRSIVVASSPYK